MERGARTRKACWRKCAKHLAMMSRVWMPVGICVHVWLMSVVNVNVNEGLGIELTLMMCLLCVSVAGAMRFFDAPRGMIDLIDQNNTHTHHNTGKKAACTTAW